MHQLMPVLFCGLATREQCGTCSTGCLIHAFIYLISVFNLNGANADSLSTEHNRHTQNNSLDTPQTLALNTNKPHYLQMQ